MEKNVELEKFYALPGKLDKLKTLGSESHSFDARGRNVPQEVAYEVGRKIALTLRRFDQQYFLVSGDSRVSTPYIMEAVTQAMVDQGITVIYAGYNNITPMFDVTRNQLRVSGANVTASHQSWEYNGLKLVVEADPSDNVERLLKGTVKVGKVLYAQEQLGKHYLDYLSKKVGKVENKEKILYDAIEGSSLTFFEAIAREKGVAFDVFRGQPNGYFHLTDHGPDPSRESNFDILRRNVANLSKYSIVCIVDGDGDRFGAATPKGIIKPAVLVALRAKHLHPKQYVAEYCLASIIAEFLSPDTEVVPVKRGRIYHIAKTKQLGMPGSEIGLHHYNSLGIDDAVENSFDFIRIANELGAAGLEETIRQVAESIRKSIPEVREKTNRDPKQIVEELATDYPDAKQEHGKLVDGIVVEPLPSSILGK